MTQILDNLNPDTRLGTHVQKVFDSFQTMDVATGYFNLRGWSMFVDPEDCCRFG